MKKIILRNGITGGLIVASVLAFSTIHCTQTGSYEGNMLLGYAAMILSFAFIFVAVKQVRDKQNGGVISFAKAFKTAVLVTLVTSTVYVVVWLFCYYLFIPDFMDKYAAFVLEKARTDGSSAAEMAKQTEQMQSYKDMYQNPLFVILLTYMEILPVGVLVSVVAALLLKRKDKNFGNSVYATGGA